MVEQFFLSPQVKRSRIISKRNWHMQIPPRVAEWLMTGSDCLKLKQINFRKALKFAFLDNCAQISHRKPLKPGVRRPLERESKFQPKYECP